jgi:protocatechuate 3,4-dioxygenase beta subunit
MSEGNGDTLRRDALQRGDSGVCGRVISCRRGQERWRTEFELCGCESFDDGHRSAALGTAPQRVRGGSGRGFRFVFRWSGVESGEAPWQQRGAPSIGEEAEVADADEALGEQVKEEATEKLIARERDHFLSLAVIPSLSLSEAAWAWQHDQNARKPTAWDEIGPFYKRAAARTTQLRRPGDPGLPVHVSGQVFDTRGEVLSGAKIEVWQADHFGHYDLDGYDYRALLTADREGKYGFDSVMPGHYPGRVCQHIHYLVSAPGHKPLTTQLYFATDPVFEGDPQRNYTRDPLIQSSELVRPVTLAGDPKEIHAVVNFEIVLEQL